MIPPIERIKILFVSDGEDLTGRKRLYEKIRDGGNGQR